MDKFEYIEYDLNSQTYVDCETTLYQSYEKKQDGILQYEKVIKDTPSKNSTVVTKEKKKRVFLNWGVMDGRLPCQLQVLKHHAAY